MTLEEKGITLEEAIKFMCEDVRRNKVIGEDALANAEQLGIEALKGICNYREGQDINFELLLLGETEK